MDHDLRALYEILDCQIVKGKPEDEFRGYLSSLERKYENQKQFIRSLECNSHVGIEEDKLLNALIPEDLPSSADKIYKAVKTTGNGDCLYNAVSMALVGDESYAILLRLLLLNSPSMSDSTHSIPNLLIFLLVVGIPIQYFPSA